MQKMSGNGKFFTERVSKRSVEVLVVMVRGEASGHIYVLPTQRVKDVLNNSAEAFLALTDVKLTASDGTAQEVPFVALNKQHIVSVVPVDEDKVLPPREEEGYYPY